MKDSDCLSGGFSQFDYHKSIFFSDYVQSIVQNNHFKTPIQFL